MDKDAAIFMCCIILTIGFLAQMIILAFYKFRQ